ncbi:alpha/beta fold hydrolase [Dactylosporangium sp. NPDC000555]|uniref:alpha/beta fold hydrolase n=1 Tax=Dactylosporangium sp. NPDC000555 TaxID=3154260 RepID=UPI00331F4232
MASHPVYRAWGRSVMAAAVAAFTVSAGPAAAAPPAGGPSWTDCGDGFQCASVTVPLNYADPSAATIHIGLSRLPATGGAAKGSIIVNAGTQNGGGTTFVRAFRSVLSGLNRDYDIVGLDTRGVGTSDPLVRCTTYEENRQVEAPLSAAQTRADRDQRVREAHGLTAYCRERSAALLPYLSSTTSARDLDRVRIALGEPGVRFIGLSGGSILGQNYLKMFPDRVTAMVLDSPFDPERYINDPFAFDIDQMRATEHTLDTFFRWCKDTPALCAFGGGDPRGAFEQLLAKTRQNRIDHPGRWDIVTDGSLIDYISGAMLFPQGWPDLSQALAAMQAQPLPTVQLPTGDDRGFAEYYSQACLDRALPRTPEPYDRQLDASLRATRYLGGRYGYAEMKCEAWPVTAAERTSEPWLNPGRRPVLVLSATDDPLAPSQGALQVAARLQADAVVLNASGHLQLGRTPCADSTVQAFLSTGRAPRFGLCSVPLPGH